MTDKRYIVEMPDGSEWAIPVMLIARSRAEYYATKEFDGDIERSLAEDTLPLFAGDDYEIRDWAQNNMNWDDVAEHAVQVKPANVDFQEGWINGQYLIEDA